MGSKSSDKSGTQDGTGCHKGCPQLPGPTPEHSLAVCGQIWALQSPAGVKKEAIPTDSANPGPGFSPAGRVGAEMGTGVRVPDL